MPQNVKCALCPAVEFVLCERKRQPKEKKQKRVRPTKKLQNEKHSRVCVRVASVCV